MQPVLLCHLQQLQPKAAHYQDALRNWTCQARLPFLWKGNNKPWLSYFNLPWWKGLSSKVDMSKEYINTLLLPKSYEIYEITHWAQWNLHNKLPKKVFLLLLHRLRVISLLISPHNKKTAIDCLSETNYLFESSYVSL